MVSAPSSGSLVLTAANQSCHNQSKGLYATFAFWQKTAFSCCWSVTFHLIAISWVNICGTKWRNPLSSSEMNSPNVSLLHSLLLVHIYWDECIKACPIWWAAPSFPPIEGGNYSSMLHHFIQLVYSFKRDRKWQVLAQSEQFRGSKEKMSLLKNCFSLPHHEQPPSLWCDPYLELWCLIRKTELRLRF